MALPLLLLAGATLAGREAYAGKIRGDFADQVREGIGERPQLVGPGMDESGAELAGPPQQRGGRGLLGAISDPAQQAYLEMLGKVAGVRHAPMNSILQGIAQVAGESGAERRQERGFAHDVGMQGSQQAFGRETQAASQEFQRISQMNDQEYRSFQNQLDRDQRTALQRNDHAQAWGLAKFRESMETLRAQNRSTLGQGQAYYAGPPIGPGGQPVPIVGPQSGTEQYVKGVEAVRGARNAVSNVDDLLTSYHAGGQGREFSGKEAGKQAAMYQRLVSDMAKAADLGTIQKGDLEFIQTFQKDPTAFWTKVFSNDETMIGTLDRTRDAFAQNYSMRREANPWTQGLRGDLATDLGGKPTAESVARARSGRADAETRARLEAVTAPGQRAAGRIGGR